MTDKEQQMNGLKLKYPSEWTMESITADAAAFLPPGSAITDITGEKFTVMNTTVKKFEKMPGLEGAPLTAENIAETSLKAMKAKGYKSEQNSITISVGGLEGRMFSVESDVGGTILKIDQYFVVKGEKVYLIAHSANAQEYKKNLATVSKMIGSIVFS
ncbi:MAG: hypothetical protein ABID61_06625 [Candidatus Micrarchaeota archaeon]